MKIGYNTKFTLPKQTQRSGSVLQDGSRSLGLFWKKKNPSYNRRNTVNLMPLLSSGSIHVVCRRQRLWSDCIDIQAGLSMNLQENGCRVQMRCEFRHQVHFSVVSAFYLVQNYNYYYLFCEKRRAFSPSRLTPKVCMYPKVLKYWDT